MEYDNYDMDEYGNLDFTEPSKDETKSTIKQQCFKCVVFYCSAQKTTLEIKVCM